MDNKEPIALKASNTQQWNLYFDGSVVHIERHWEPTMAIYLTVKLIRYSSFSQLPEDLMWELIDLIKVDELRNEFMLKNSLVRPTHVYEPCRLISEKYYVEGNEWKTSYYWRLFNTGDVIYTERTWDQKYEQYGSTESTTNKRFDVFLTPETLWELLDTANPQDAEAFIKKFSLVRPT